jgi:hypothetical protein
MTEKRPRPTPEHTEPTETTEIRRSASEVALVATPIAIAAQPVIAALAGKYIGKSESDPPPQEPPKKD